MKFKTSFFQIFVFCSFVTLGGAYGQNLNMSNGSFTRCSGNFYDHAGTNNYSNNQNITTTICPGNPGSFLRVSFTAFDLETNWDELTIYDGNSTAGANLGTFTGNLPAFSVQATNPSGCLTFVFTSDGSTVRSGFVAQMACIYPCQPITASVQSSTPAMVNGVIDACLGDVITLTGTGTYTTTNQLYPQSNANCSFTWDIGDGRFATGQTTTFQYLEPGVYDVDLKIRDINDCDNTNDINLLIRISDTTGFVGTNAAQTDICLGETNVLTGFAQEKEIEYYCVSVLPDTTFLPDGIGISYSSSITLDCFNAGATVTSASDIQSICIDLEHSYLLDLDIELVCPNGTSIFLWTPPLSALGIVELGEPVDNDASSTLGDPYNYCFTNTAAQTWAEVGFPINPLTPIPRHNYVDNDGTNRTNVAHIPAGNYLPDESFAGLAGCPLNGDWQIVITDYLSSDNGSIFNWSIDFAPALYSNASNYTPQITDTVWLADPSIIATNGNQITVQPTTAGNHCYTFRATDEFNCEHDTVICFNVTPGEDSTFAYSQAGYCTNEANPSPTISGTAGGTFTSAPAGLTIDATSGAIDLATSTPGTYTVTYTTPGVGCQTSLDRTVSVNDIPSGNMTGGGTICQGQTLDIQVDLFGGSPWNIVYNDGVANVTVNGITTSPYIITTSIAGNYSLVSVANAACTGSATGNANVVVNETVNYSNVTAICAADNLTYTVSFELNNGDPMTYAVTGMNGGTITNPSAGVYVFTSNDINAGTPNYTFNFQDGNGCNVETITGVQNCSCSASASLSGTNTICAGDSALLTVNFVGTAPFDFDYQNGATTGTFTGVPNPFSFYVSNAGTYSLTRMEDGVACAGSVSGNATITVNPIPTVSVDDQEICEGGNVDITATPSSNGGTYAWTPGPLPNTQTVNVSPASSQYYYVTYTLNGCSNNDSSYVTVKPVPTITINDTTVCNGASANIQSVVDIAGGSYLWSPGTFGDVDNITVTPSSTTVYAVTYTLDGCVATDNATVTVVAAPALTMTDATICVGETATVKASGSPVGGTYAWQSPPAPAGSNLDSIVVSPTASTYYPVTYDYNGCTVIDSAFVTVKFKPTISVNDETICEGEQATLFATVDSTGGSYYWTPAPLPNTQQINVSPNSTSVYTLIYDVGGCRDTAISTVTVTPAPVMTVNDSTICEGEQATLTAVVNPAGGTFLWDNAGETTQDLTVSPTTTTSYNVTYDYNGCLTNSSGTVFVNPLPTVVASSNSPVCAGTSLNLDGQPGGGTYEWIGPNAFTSNQQAPSINNVDMNVAGQYTLTVTVDGCSNSNTVDVVVNEIVADFISDVTEGCGPLSVNFTNNTASSVDCLWSFGDGSTGTDCATSNHNYTMPGSYTVSLTVTDANGCSDYLEFPDMITVESAPDAQFTPTPSVLYEGAQTSAMVNQTLGAASYLWVFPDGSTSNETNPSHTFNLAVGDSGAIRLYAFSPFGCVDSLVKYVTLEEEITFYIPNSFTPDGDMNNNEFFPVLTAGIDLETYKMTIYNRWGEIVFQTKDSRVGWDGTYSNGLKSPDGMYVYVVEFLSSQTDERKRISGHIILKR